MKLDFLKKKKKFKKENTQIQPELFWRIILSIFFIAIIFIFLFGMYVLKKIEKNPLVLDGVVVNKMETQKQQEIKKILDYFKQREEKSDQVISTQPNVIDPSL